MSRLISAGAGARKVGGQNLRREEPARSNAGPTIPVDRHQVSPIFANFDLQMDKGIHI